MNIALQKSAAESMLQLKLLQYGLSGGGQLNFGIDWS
jgi:hypothetical protein